MGAGRAAPQRQHSGSGSCVRTSRRVPWCRHPSTLNTHAAGAAGAPALRALHTPTHTCSAQARASFLPLSSRNSSMSLSAGSKAQGSMRPRS